MFFHCVAESAVADYPFETLVLGLSAKPLSFKGPLA